MYLVNKWKNLKPSLLFIRIPVNSVIDSFG